MADPLPSIDDPRLCSGFEPAHFPRCDGGEAPPSNTEDRIDRRKIQFLAAYYGLNRLYARLHAIRSGTSQEDDRPVLMEIQEAIQRRDALEDFYEPEGFLGEPVMEGIFYKDIEFTYARRREFYQATSSSSFSLYLPLPPPGVDVESWVREHLAKVFPEMPASGPPMAPLPAKQEGAHAVERLSNKALET